jgi:AraC family transcriptional regulator of arabinose operon
MQRDGELLKRNQWHIADVSALRAASRDRRVRAAIDYLAAHDLKRNFRIDQLSRHVNLSTTRLHHLFHEEFGLSPGQIFKLRRMREARELLASTFMSVKEVMAAVGLNDLSHFVRDFKRAFGKTPSEFRKEMETAIPSGEMEGRSGIEGT